jgi:hypothetical protein
VRRIELILKTRNFKMALMDNFKIKKYPFHTSFSLFSSSVSSSHNTN